MTNREFSKHCLSVNELRSLIKKNVAAPRTVFAMTQCFSGGFHRLSVSIENGYPSADTSICGFTAVTPDSTASGCTPDVDGPGYKGYERYLAQQLTGHDVVSSQPTPYERKATLREAHRAAALEDTAKDIPFTTSDFYLTYWSKTIEADIFQPRTQSMSRDEVVALYRDALDAKDASHPAVKQAGVMRHAVLDRQAYLAGTIALLTGYDPELKTIVQKPMKDIDAYLIKLEQDRKDLEKAAQELDDRSTNLWRDYGLRPWSQALSEDRLDYLSFQQKIDFERGFMSDLETNGRSIKRDAIFRLAIWSASDPAKAESLSQYLTHRGRLRWQWLEANSSQDTLAKLQESSNLGDASGPKWELASKLEERHDQLRRVMFTRRQIAAAIALGAMQDKDAATTLTGLQECEATPFRKTNR